MFTNKLGKLNIQQAVEMVAVLQGFFLNILSVCVVEALLINRWGYFQYLHMYEIYFDNVSQCLEAKFCLDLYLRNHILIGEHLHNESMLTVGHDTCR